MIRLNNRHWITLDGAPVTGRTPPRVCVYGPKMTGAQEAQVRQIYKLFTDVCLVSVGDYQVRRRVLGDGTRVRCTSFMGQDFVEVWTAGGSPCPDLETLFFGVPSSSTSTSGVLAPEVGVWNNYHTSPPPDALEPYCDLDERPGNVTWYSKDIKLKIPTSCPQKTAGTVVLSWRGPAHRYGGYSSFQSNEQLFTTEQNYPRLEFEVAPGAAYAGDAWLRSTYVWINGIKYDTGLSVVSAALKVIQDDGLYLYVTTAESYIKIAVHRGRIDLPKDEKPAMQSLTMALVSEIVLPELSIIWQAPYFDEACSRVAFIADFEDVPVKQSRVVVADVETGAYATHFSATQATILSSGGTVLIGAEIEGDITSVVTYGPSAYKNNKKYPLAADFVRNELSFIYADVTSEESSIGSEHRYTKTDSSARPIIAVSTCSLIEPETFNKLTVEVISNTSGIVYSMEDKHEGYVNISGFSSSSVVGPSTATCSGSEVSLVFSSNPKAGLVAGDIRFDAFVFSISGFDRKVIKELSLSLPSGWPFYVYHPYATPTGTILVDYSASGSQTISAAASVRYAVVHNKQTLAEHSGYLVPSIEVDSEISLSSYAGTKSISWGYTNHSTAPKTSRNEFPYRTPVSQPIVLRTDSAVNYSAAFNDSLVSLNANNQPGAFARVAFSPLDDDGSVVGYIGWASPVLRDPAGAIAGRATFERFYVKGQWVDSPGYADGPVPTIAGAVFTGTRPKRTK